MLAHSPNIQRISYSFTLCSLYLWLLAPILLLVTGCDDPTPGPIGGLVLVIRSFEATKDPELKAIESIEIQTEHIEVMHSNILGGGEDSLIVDTQVRTISINNDGETDRLIGQYQVPPGYVSQIRIFPRAVTLHLKNGMLVPLEVPSSNIPSWGQSGWKIESADGKPWPIQLGELTGVRALFHFDDRMLHNKGNGYKIKPTCPAEIFNVNPTNNGPGVYMDQITVLFREGVRRDQVDNITSQIGAAVLREPLATQAYRIKIPVSVNLQDAFNFFTSQPEVASVLPAVNFSPAQLTPAEGISESQMNANLPAAWEVVNNRTGSVGSHRVLVANIDTPINVAHADLVPNTIINQGEIPPNLLALIADVDHDNYITFYDLNSDPNYGNSQIATDRNNNGCIDAYDLLNDIGPGRWINNFDDDHDDTWNPKGEIKDDLIGYHFVNGNADVTLKWDSNERHGTLTSLILGGAANNENGTINNSRYGCNRIASNGDVADNVGASWNVSIVPLVVGSPNSPTADLSNVFIPQEAVMDAMRYAEDKTFYNKQLTEPTRIDIANVELWYQALHKNGTKFGDILCSFKGGTTTDLTTFYDIPDDLYASGIATQEQLFSVSPWKNNGTTTSHVLYVWAAGNSAFNLGRYEILNYLSEPMRSVIPNNFIMVGGSAVYPQIGGGVLEESNGSSNYGADVIDIYASAASTSFAAPVVSGTAALLVSLDPCVRNRTIPCTLRGKPTELKHRIAGIAPRTVTVVSSKDPRGSCYDLEMRGKQPRLDAYVTVQ